MACNLQIVGKPHIVQVIGQTNRLNIDDARPPFPRREAAPLPNSSKEVWGTAIVVLCLENYCSVSVTCAGKWIA